MGHTHWHRDIEPELQRQSNAAVYDLLKFISAMKSRTDLNYPDSCSVIT